MKITESKYYIPRRYLMEDDQQRIVVKENKQTLVASSYPYYDLLCDVLSRITLTHDDLVIHHDHLRLLERCTDFHTLTYSKNAGKLYEDEMCYYHKELRVFLLLSNDLSNDYEQQMFEDGTHKVTCVFYDNTDPEAPKNLRKLFNTVLERYISKEAKVGILFKTKRGFEIRNRQVKPFPIDFSTMYNDDFLEVHNRIMEKISHSHKGIVMLHGVAGSGKTNYIKWLTSQITHKQFVFIPSNMITSLTDPIFTELLLEQKDTVLVLEDCENYIAERTPNSANTDVVSSILNMADGILSDILECQLMCTFNSDISKIDPALLRKGRLIAEYKFTELSVEKCNAYLQAHQKTERVDKPHSLAELTNLEEKVFKNKQEAKRIGFNK